MPADIQKPQPQARAVPVGRVGGQRLLERRHRAVAVAGDLAQVAEVEPGRGKAGRPLHRLFQQVDRGGRVAPLPELARHPVAPVGDQVARRLKQGMALLR